MRRRRTSRSPAARLTQLASPVLQSPVERPQSLPLSPYLVRSSHSPFVPRFAITAAASANYREKERSMSPEFVKRSEQPIPLSLPSTIIYETACTCSYPRTVSVSENGDEGPGNELLSVDVQEIPAAADAPAAQVQLRDSRCMTKSRESFQTAQASQSERETHDTRWQLAFHFTDLPSTPPLFPAACVLKPFNVILL